MKVYRAYPTQTKNTPAQLSELHGGFVLPDRLARPIIRGIVLKVLLLKPMIVDVIADENQRHVHGQAEKDIKHDPTPPSRGLMPNLGRGSIDGIISVGLREFKLTGGGQKKLDLLSVSVYNARVDALKRRRGDIAKW